MPHKVGFLSVVQPQLPSHQAFFAAMPPNVTVTIKTPTTKGYYKGNEIVTGAADVTKPDVCAVVAADTRSAIALIEARATAALPHPPIIISVPNNAELKASIATAANPLSIHVVGAGVSEPKALAWFMLNLKHKAGLWDRGENVIALIYNHDNPGSVREVNDTVGWFAANFPPTKPKYVTVVPFGVQAQVPVGTTPADATDLYNIPGVLRQMTLLRDTRNVKAVITTGDPTIRYYRQAIKTYIADWEPKPSTAWESWYDLTQGGVICWAADRKVAWKQVTDKTLEFCGGPDPEFDQPIPNVLAGNARAAEELNIPWQDIKDLCEVPIHWFPDSEYPGFPDQPNEPPQERYTVREPEEPPTDL